MSARPYIDPAMLQRIMEPDPAASLRASATAFEAIGQPHSADFCRQMATDCASMGSIGNALYQHWAREQADRVVLCRAKLCEQDNGEAA